MHSSPFVGLWPRVQRRRGGSYFFIFLSSVWGLGLIFLGVLPFLGQYRHPQYLGSFLSIMNIRTLFS